jgi:hypothetical protein
MFKSLLIIVIFTIPLISHAHPGNTDAYGCHTCRTNCPKWGLSTGEYHCHASKGLPQPSEPVRSIKSNTGTGVTIPAPEYREPKIIVPKVEVEKKAVVEPVKPVVKAVIATSSAPIAKPALVKVEKKSWFQRLFGR